MDNNSISRTLAISTNSAYSQPAAVALRSALAAGCANIHGELFYSGSAHDQELDLLRRSFDEDDVTIHILPTKMFQRWPQKRYFGNDAVYVRLALGRLLDSSITRVVYLDCDTIVFDDITELWTTPLGNAAFGAVREMNGPYMSHHGGLHNWEEAGVPQFAPYCNSGVLTIDLNVWREEELEAKCFSFLATYGEKVRFPDQDALNATLWNRWVEFDQAYNASAFWDHPKYPAPEYGDVLKRLKIFHFQGPVKPWHSNYPVQTRKDKYDSLVQKTAWRN